MAALTSLTGMRDQGVVKFYDGARNYGICVGNSGDSTGKDVFIMGSALAPGLMPQASDVLAFTLVVKVRSSGTEKLEAANISLVSRGKGSATGSIGGKSIKNSKRNNISRDSNTSNRSGQDMAKNTAKLTVTPKGQANNNAQQKKKTGSIDANNRDQHVKQQQNKPKQMTLKKHKQDAQPKQNKAKQNRNKSKSKSKNKNKNKNSGSNSGSNSGTNSSGSGSINTNTNNSEKFAESALFSSPDPKCLPMPDIGKLQRQRTPDAKTRSGNNHEKNAESALFGSPDPTCLPMPRF